jgi:hypothetical protein
MKGLKEKYWQDGRKVIRAENDDLRLIRRLDEYNQRLDNLKATIACQTKNITRQFRVLLFPNSNAREYYRIVFGRLLFWMVIILTSA